jgi:hypothetical protein
LEVNAKSDFIVLWGLLNRSNALLEKCVLLQDYHSQIRTVQLVLIVYKDAELLYLAYVQQAIIAL